MTIEMADDIISSIVDTDDFDIGDGKEDVYSKQITVIHTKKREGSGKQNDPFHTVNYYFTLDGKLLFKKDPFNGKAVNDAK